MSTLIEMPPFWESLLKGYVKKAFYPGTRRESFADREEFTEGDYRFFAHGVQALNVAFTRERYSLPRNYLNQKELRSGYILYFLPVNALKVTALLDQNLRNFLPLRILDLGSGPGTGMLGTFLYLEKLLRAKGPQGELQLEWVLVDQNHQALKDAESLYRSALDHLTKANPGWMIRSTFHLKVGNLFSEKVSQVVGSSGLSGEADLILGLNFLSELPAGKRAPLLEVLLKRHLSEKGKILLMEPALQETTRQLMELHNEIVDRQCGFVFAPCLHQAECPMLKANNRDWCHTYIPWERPPWIEKLDRLASIRKEYLKCSYLLLGKEPPKPLPRNTWRVVSGPLNSKGKSERLLCGEAALPNLLRIVRLDKDQSAANRAFDSVERGDLVEMEKRERISRETLLSKIN